MITAQNKITILAEDTRHPIAGASIFSEGKLLGKSNQQGEFISPKSLIKISAKNYEDEWVEASGDTKVFLIATAAYRSIQSLNIDSQKQKKAFSILEKVEKNRDRNNPKSLSSYSFKSYQKFSVDIDSDSVQTFQNYYQQNLGKDTRFQKIASESGIFLWERALQYYFVSGKEERTVVMDQKMSGTQQPVYELLALKTKVSQFPDFLEKQKRELYRFYLQDSVVFNQRPTYIISFRQISYPKSKKEVLSGRIYIDQQNYGIAKVEKYNGKAKNEFSIDEWVFNHDVWFLKREFQKIYLGSWDFGKQKVGRYAFLKSDYYDIKAPDTTINPKVFNSYALTIKEGDGKLLPEYRTDSLSAREKATYYKIDSISKKSHWETKLNFLAQLSRGRLRWKFIDIPVDKWLVLNGYENYRPGLKLKTNEYFSKYWSPDIYVGYGFGDKKWKYTAGVDVKTSLDSDAVVRAEYTDMVEASGKFKQELWTAKMMLMNSAASIGTLNFYHYKGWKLSFRKHLFNNISYQLQLAYLKENALFDYSFLGENRIFNNPNLRLTLKYAPRNRSMMTPTGRLILQENSPSFYFNYENSFRAFDGDYRYQKFDFLALYKTQTLLGVTEMRAYGGLLTGEAPMWQSFEAGGLRPDRESFISKLNLTSFLGFATMPSGNFYHDRFVAFYIGHKIPWYFKSFGKNISSFDVVYKGIVGEYKNANLHQVKIESLNHLYQEVGLEWNNFLSTQFNLGFFYRVGYYQTSSFKDNFAIQLKLKILGF